MVAKREVRKQQDSSRSAQDPLAHLLPVAQNPRPQPRQGQRVRLSSRKAAWSALDPSNPTGILGLAEAFNAAVAQGVEDSDPSAVHRMRTGSRRLQALLEAALRETGPTGSTLERPTRSWLRELKQVRRAAGVVRDLDVQRNLLEDWIGKRMPKQESTPVSETSLPAEVKQAELLDAWLKSERKQLARGMQKQLKKRQQALAEGQGALFTAITRVSVGSSSALRAADAMALEEFVRATDAMPSLDAENLHDFRKATKKARYLAEAGVEGDSSSVAKALKRIQDAIGEWHDWLCLGEELQEALGQDAPELSVAFQGEIERHFTAALKTTQSMRGRLLGEWMAATKSPGKRPPSRAALGDHRVVSNQRTA
jgi:CHAD domain-containing protein